MLTRFGSRQAQVDAQLVGRLPGRAEVALYSRRVSGDKAFVVNEITHRPILSRKARLAEVVTKMLDEDGIDLKAVRKANQIGKLV